MGQHALDAGMEPLWTLRNGERLPQPAGDASFVRRVPEHLAPAGNFPSGNPSNLVHNAFGEGRASLAFRIDEADQDNAAACVHFMRDVGPDEYRLTRSPLLLMTGSYPQRSAQRHDHLHTVMAMLSMYEAGTPHDH